jgi:hypothetical protein
MKILASGIAAFMIILFARDVPASWNLDMEGGEVFNSYNDVRIPGDTGTRFSLTDDLNADPSGFFRARAGYDFGARHSVSALVAPLRVHSSGTIDRQVNFMGTVFAPGSRLESRFRFDSYRLTYRYDFFVSDSLTAGAGLTGKIRDASISVTDGTQTAEKTNTGFVPLVNFRVSWFFAKPIGLLIEGDALAAPQGRAEDVLAALQYRLNDTVTFKVGYRMLEGGSDNDKVYTFSMFHYALAGVIIQL